MLNEKIIVIPSTDDRGEVCDYVLQTSRELAKTNTVIVIELNQARSLYEFIKDHTRKKIITHESGIWYVSPLLLIPFRRFKVLFELSVHVFIYAILILGFLQRKKVIMWLFFPSLSWMVSPLVRAFFHVHFDIVDYYTATDSSAKKVLRQQKKSLLRNSDTVSAISKELEKAYQRIYNRSIQLVPQGFRLSEFEKQSASSTIKFPTGKPIVGFVGQINERLDYDLLSELIPSLPMYNFVFVGPKKFDSNVSKERSNHKFELLLQNKNSFWFDAQPRETIKTIISAFSVGIIPYNCAYTFNKYSYPMKVFEYFYLTKPVLATPISSLIQLGVLVKVGKNSSEWRKHLKKILNEGWSKKLQVEQKKLAENNSWVMKVGKIMALIEKASF